MGKKKRKANAKRKTESKPIKQHTQFQLVQPQDTPKAPRIRKKVLGIFSLLIALIPFGFYVWPRVSVYPGETLNPLQPLETHFIIKNDGNLPLYNIDYSIRAAKVKYSNNNTISNSTYTGLSTRIPKISANTSSPIPVSINRFFYFPGNITYAELYFYITYRPSLIPFTFKDIRRFKIEKKRDGGFVWEQYFIEE